MFTVGPVAGELLPRPRSTAPTTRSSSTRARRRRGCSGRSRRRGVTLDAILLTHTHFDHVGAVAPIARATGAPVYCPQLEVPVLQDVMAYVPWPGFGPFESLGSRAHGRGRRDARARRASTIDVDLHARPQPRPRHLRDPTRRSHGAVLAATCSSRARSAAIDLPGGDWPTLLALDRRRCSSATTTTRPSTPATWASRRSAPSARRNPFLAELLDLSERSAVQAPRGTYDVLPEAADARASLEATARARSSRARATAASRRRPSSTPSCSPAASASRPTSSRRRCTPSTTAASARSRCAPRAPRRSAAPTSSTACTSCPSR